MFRKVTGFYQRKSRKTAIHIQPELPEEEISGISANNIDVAENADASSELFEVEANAAESETRFFSGKKKTKKRKIIVRGKGLGVAAATNAIIAAVLFSLAAITFSGGYVFSAFGQKNNKAIYIGNTSEPRVSLMINVYWGTEFIEPMLKILEENGVKTTFFVGGSWAEGNPEMLKKIAEAGHEIGNHGYFHKDHKKLNADDNKREIERCSIAVEKITGKKMNLFAPPSGAYSEATVSAAENLGYRTIMWSKDTVDWRDKDSELIFKRAASNPANGDLVLMHPTERTLEALPLILKELKEKGFSVVTVSANLS